MTLPIRTRRLVLRRFTSADIPDLIELTAHPSVSHAVPEMKRTEAAMQAYVNRQNSYLPFEPDRVFDLAIERKKDGKVIGLLTLVRKESGQGGIGWALGVRHRGRGYATEAAEALMEYAFTALGLERIEAETSIGNEGSWRVMERLGMRREAMLREATLEGGSRLDSYVYGILADEWGMRRGAETGA